VQKPPPPPTWSVFGPIAGTQPFTRELLTKIIRGEIQGLPPGVVPNFLPLWLGILVLGGGSLTWLVLPKLIDRDLPAHKMTLGGLAAFLALAVLGVLGLGMGWDQGLFIVFFGFLCYYFGFVMPQRHIRSLDWTRYAITMSLVISTVGVLLKMGARLVFQIKYLLTIPAFNFNI